MKLYFLMVSSLILLRSLLVHILIQLFFSISVQWLWEYLPRFQRIICICIFSICLASLHMSYLRCISRSPPHNFIGQNWIRVNTGICLQAKWATKSATSVSSVFNFKKRFEAVQAMNWSFTKRKFQYLNHYWCCTKYS